MRSKSILILQRELSLTEELVSIVSRAGYVCHQLPEAAQAVHTVLSFYDLVLLDAVLRNGSGIAACSDFRRQSGQVPIIFVTSADNLNLKHAAFEAGADDFIVRPLDAQELILRVGAVLRRTIPRAPHPNCVVGPSVVNLGTGKGLRMSAPISLTARELELLRYLYQRKDCLIPREELLREVWKYTSTHTRTVEMHMATLRRKLEADPRSPQHLLTVRRHGYVFRAA